MIRGSLFVPFLVSKSVYGVYGDSSVPASFDTSRGSSMRDILSEAMPAARGPADFGP